MFNFILWFIVIICIIVVINFIGLFIVCIFLGVFEVIILLLFVFISGFEYKLFWISINGDILV